MSTRECYNIRRTNNYCVISLEIGPLRHICILIISFTMILQGEALEGQYSNGNWSCKIHSEIFTHVDQHHRELGPCFGYHSFKVRFLQVHMLREMCEWGSTAIGPKTMPNRSWARWSKAQVRLDRVLGPIAVEMSLARSL
jgi:hypothetical protein